MKSKKSSYNKILVLFCIIVVSVLMTGCDNLPIVLDFSASPSTINQGESSTLSWSVSDADKVTITPGVVGTVESSGSISVSPVVTTVYTLTATNSAGSVTATATVTVIPLSEPIVNIFSASPSTINQGESSTLTWAVSEADTVTITPEVGKVASSGSTTVSPVVTTVYTLTATNGAGSVTATATVTVIPLSEPIVNIFSASPSTINQGESSTLTWSVSDADKVNINPWVGPIESSGSTTVSPVVTTVYTLTATNTAGSVTATTTVTVSSVAVTGVTLDQATMTLTAGGATGTLVATVAPADATDKSVTWSSSAPAVATVANGVVTPLTASTTTITVTTVDGGFTATCAVTVNPAPVAVGDSYGGGIVAYILQSGDPGYDANIQHGLIAAPVDQSTDVQWYNGSFMATGATGTAIGTGQSNTTSIVIIQGAGSYAAKLCNALTVGGYNDWFLPSKDELNKLYINEVAIGGFADDRYWSSSESSASLAWYQHLGNGYQYNVNKYHTFRVRAVRAF